MTDALFLPGKWLEISCEQLLSASDDAPLLRFSGVYAFYIKETCMYIGSSVFVRSRLLSHLLDGFAKDIEKEDVTIKIRRNKSRFEHLTLEARLIYKIQPEYNKRIPTAGWKKAYELADSYVVPGASERCFDKETDEDYSKLIKEKIEKVKATSNSHKE